MMDPNYAAMYGSYEQLAMSQQGYGPMPPPSFSSKEELKQHASSYVQQQLAMMGHPPTSRHASGGGSSSRQDSAAGFYSTAGWAGGYIGAAAAAGGVKKSGRGRGRPPGSKNQTHSNADTAADASAAAAAAEQQLYQQQQYSINARASQDEAATWCSTGMMLTGSAAAGAPQGSPGGEVHSSANYMAAQHMPPCSTAADPATAGTSADPLDPAALAAAPMPLAAAALKDPVGAAAADIHAAVAADAADAAGPEICGLLPTSAAAAAELNRIPGLPGFRVSMTGLDFELEAAGNGNTCVRFSSRSLKLLEYEEGACMPGYKPSYSSMDFRNSLTSFDDILGDNAANRMSDHTHIAMRAPSWDGAGSSPRSQPLDAAAATGPATGAAAAAPAAAAAAAGYAHGSSDADNALAAAFKQQQVQQQSLMPPPSSSGLVHGSSWVSAQQPPNSAAAAAAAAAAAVPAGLVSGLSGVHSGSFSFPAAAPAQDDIHPGAITAPSAAEAGAAGAEATPFGAAPLQAVPFSPVGDAATAAGLSASAGAGADLMCAEMGQAAEQGPNSQLMGSKAQQPAAVPALEAERLPPAAPRMPPAFHSVLQALQPPAQQNGGSCSTAAHGGGSLSLLHVKSEQQVAQQQVSYQQQQYQQTQQHTYMQQPMGHESALAAASPAITGLGAPAGAACAVSMVQASFMLPAAAAVHNHGLQQQQQMAMPMPLPLQLMVPPQHQQVSGHRVSDLNMGPLPSPIDLFHGDHGLHTDDLLIGTEEVFDEQLLCTHDGQHIQQQQQPPQHQQQQQAAPASAHMLHGMTAAQLVSHTFGQYQPTAAGQVRQGQSTGAAAGQQFPAGSCQHSAMQAPHAAQDAGIAGNAAGRQHKHPDASTRAVAKRRRSSTNGSTWSKKQRPSEGSLVEVYNARHGMDDCLHLWQHD